MIVGRLAPKGEVAIRAPMGIFIQTGHSSNLPAPSLAASGRPFRPNGRSKRSHINRPPGTVQGTHIHSPLLPFIHSIKNYIFAIFNSTNNSFIFFSKMRRLTLLGLLLQFLALLALSNASGLYGGLYGGHGWGAAPYWHSHDGHEGWHGQHGHHDHGQHHDGYGRDAGWGHDKHNDDDWDHGYKHGDAHDDGHAAGYVKGDKTDWSNYQYGGQGNKAQGDSYAKGYNSAWGDGHDDGHDYGHAHGDGHESGWGKHDGHHDDGHWDGHGGDDHWAGHGGHHDGGYGGYGHHGGWHRKRR